MRPVLALSIALLVAVSISPAYAQDDPSPAGEELPQIENIDQLLELLDAWEGDPAELQAIYETLDPNAKAEVDENFELWSIEGGLGLGGGYQLAMGDIGKNQGTFRLSGSIGAVWPVGDFALPIYYALPDIPGPWGVGFQVHAFTDNVDKFGGAVTFRWAYEYIGTTPTIDLGPVVRHGDDELSIGGRLGLGYGNILFQGFVETDYYADDQILSIVGGIRLPWLLATLI